MLFKIYLLNRSNIWLSFEEGNFENSQTLLGKINIVFRCKVPLCIVRVLLNKWEKGNWWNYFMGKYVEKKNQTTNVQVSAKMLYKCYTVGCLSLKLLNEINE